MPDDSPDSSPHDHSAHGHGHEGQGNCDEALQELYTFLDGELTEQKRSVIKHHLDDCSPCLEVYDFEAELRLVIKHRCQEQVPDSLRQKVANKLAAIDEELRLGGASTGADAPS
jgi:mycothiol system anti-sigma-R factor